MFAARVQARRPRFNSSHPNFTSYRFLSFPITSCRFLSFPITSYRFLSLPVASCRFLSLPVASKQFHRSLVLSTLSFRLTPDTFVVRSLRPKTPLTSTASLESRDSNTQRALSHTLTSRFSTHHDHEAARDPAAAEAHTGAATCRLHPAGPISRQHSSPYWRIR